MRQELPSLSVTPESVAAFCAQPEFEFMLAALLFELRIDRKALENANPDNAGLIGASQGKIAAIGRILQADFPDLLTRICVSEIDRDGGKSLLFGLRVHMYTESLLSQG